MIKTGRFKLLETAKITVEKSGRNSRDPQQLEALADNLRENGVLQPILVVKRKRGYSLLAGERRLLAAREAGLVRIPALVLHGDAARGEIISLCENLHREPLCCFDQAQMMKSLLDDGMSRKELSAALSLSPSAIANKLRTLLLAEDQRQFVIESGLSERHVREIIRLPEDLRDSALYDVAAQGLSVAATARLVDRLLGCEKGQTRRHAVVKDVRLFFNTITRAVEVMNRSGLGATAIRRDTPTYIEYIIKIPAAPDRTRLV